MQKKAVIGIDLDAALKKTLVKAIKKWHDLPIKWHKEDSFHIRLLPLGWVGEDDIIDIRDRLSDIAGKNEGFRVEFDRVEITAKDPRVTNIENAQLVRLVGSESDELKQLYAELADELEIPISSKKNFRPIVEIGRMRAKKWQVLDEYPEKDIPFSVTMDVTSLTLFETIVDDGKRHVVPVDVFEIN